MNEQLMIPQLKPSSQTPDQHSTCTGHVYGGQHSTCTMLLWTGHRHLGALARGFSCSLDLGVIAGWFCAAQRGMW